MPLSNQDKSNVEALQSTIDTVIDQCLALRKELESLREATTDNSGLDFINAEIIAVDRMRFKWQKEHRRLDNVKSPGHLQFMIQRLELEQATA